MKGDNICYQDLFSELSEYERRGVHITINDAPASPLQVVSAVLAEEEKSYMRDYDLTEQGNIRGLNFCPI